MFYRAAPLRRVLSMAACALTWCLIMTPQWADARNTFTRDPEYLIDIWETEDGLPENSATAMVQTPDGYLWFSTFNGLVRFDGVKFKIFNRDNTPQLPSDSIANLHLDLRGALWLSTYEGIAVFDGREWRAFRRAEGWEGDLVRTFANGANGKVLLTSFSGNIHEFFNGSFVRLPTPPGEHGQGYFGHADEEGRWCVAQSGFVWRFESGKWISLLTTAGVARDAVASAAARDGSTWLLQGRQLNKVRHGEKVRGFTLPESPGGVWSLSEDSRTNVWIATHDRGVCRLSPDGEMRRWGATNGLAYHGTRFVFEDRERNLWIGSSGGGLVRFKPRRARTIGPESGLPERIVHSVAPSASGGVWIGTYGSGVFRWRDHLVTEFVPANGPALGRYVQSVYEDRHRRLWVGLFNVGVKTFDSNGVPVALSGRVGGGNVLSIFEDSRGRIWMGDGQGVTVCESNVLRVLAKEHGLPNGGVRCFAEDSLGMVWLSNHRGVFRLDGDRFVEVRNQNEALSEIDCLRADVSGDMWLGSLKRGLLYGSSGQFTRLDSVVEFPAQSIHGIIEDGRGFFWMPSNRGIVRASRAELLSAFEGKARSMAWQIIDVNDGLASRECTSGHQPVCARDDQGQFWFATPKGVAVIDPETFQLNTLPPLVHIEEVVYRVKAAPHNQDSRLSDEKEVRVFPPFTVPLKIPAGSRRLEIHYTATTFSTPEKIRFQTMLTRGEWDDVGNRRVTEFHELPPGDHVFRVRAANDDGVWNKTGATLAFTVHPFYWQTRWFRVAVAFLLVAAGSFATAWISGLRRKRERAERQRAQAEKAARDVSGRLITAHEDERRRLARDLHDDLNQRLALLSVELELLGRHEDGEDSDEVTAAARIGDIASRVKELSSDVHRLSYQLHPAKLDQLGLVSAARGLCRDLSKTSGVQIEFVNHEVPRDLPPEVALCIYRVIQEALQNVVKHSGAQSARVEVKAQNGMVIGVISDNGKGFEGREGGPSKGMGLISIEERVRLVQGTVTVRSKPGEGTRIDLGVPIKSRT